MRQDYFSWTITKFIKMLLSILKLTFFANLRDYLQGTVLERLFESGYTKGKSSCVTIHGIEVGVCSFVVCGKTDRIKACAEVLKTFWLFSDMSILWKQSIDFSYCTSSYCTSSYGHIVLFIWDIFDDNDAGSCASDIKLLPAWS